MTNDLLYELFLALCLMLVIEGILPFVYPARWRKLVEQLSEIDDAAIRIIGLVSMLAGVAGIYLVR
ncbi:hypothetical protein A9R01_10530 ['Osedax' symbiont bacterium Rs2_46_30_T18]|nr:hypothetical protein A9R01_10530 ['Osedax' symbiont bacterium Rs2_46_30_T18]